MQYEIGLVPHPEGAATEIVGPFLTAEAAAKAAIDRNKEQKRRAYPSWMWARLNEIPRAKDCIDRVNS